MSAVVIGVGNALRRDDGVGLALAARLREDAPPRTRVLAFQYVPAELCTHWEDAERVILIDAAKSGAAPGTLHHFDAVTGPIPATTLRLSTHGFGLGEALELARAIGQLPAQVTVYAIEGADFGDGEGLSPPVAAALDDLARLVRAELEGARA